jgi:hypothetical protein
MRIKAAGTALSTFRVVVDVDSRAISVGVKPLPQRQIARASAVYGAMRCASVIAGNNSRQQLS